VRPGLVSLLLVAQSLPRLPLLLASLLTLSALAWPCHAAPAPLPRKPDLSAFVPVLLPRHLVGTWGAIWCGRECVLTFSADGAFQRQDKPELYGCGPFGAFACEEQTYKGSWLVDGFGRLHVIFSDSDGCGPWCWIIEWSRDALGQIERNAPQGSMTGPHRDSFSGNLWMERWPP
jgi:hypothetical protein